MSRPRLLSSAEAARAAGVGPSSVKRWADRGLLPCVRTAGGHRRFEPAALRQFLRSRGSLDGDPSLGASADTAVGAWVDRLVEGRRHDVDAALLEARARLGAWHAVADELGPALTELGRRWQRGTVSIADEHAATECLTRALARVGDLLPGARDGPRCLLACVEGDEHTLGLALAELCLRESGWVPLWLGRRTPRGEVVRVVRDGGAEMVALSASEASDDAALLSAVAGEVGSACRERGAVLVLGGTGAWPARPRVGRRVSTFGEFHDLLAGRPAAR